MSDEMMDDVTRGNDPPPEMEKMQGDWHLRQEIKALKIALANSESRVTALEAEVQRLHGVIVTETNRAQTAWRERDEMAKGVLDMQKLLQMSVGLLAHFAGTKT